MSIYGWYHLNFLASGKMEQYFLRCCIEAVKPGWRFCTKKCIALQQIVSLYSGYNYGSCSKKLFSQKNLWNCVKHKPVGILTCIFEPTCLLTLSESTGASHHIFLFVNENWWFRTLSQLLLQADAAAAIQVFENCRKDFSQWKQCHFLPLLRRNFHLSDYCHL